jgi:NAD(P)-dependent dehydrogenase (short-subunit alcohol dehydrogenase family)
MTRSALVTGAGRRIGRTIAIELARAGFDVAIHYGGSREEAEAVADEIRALGRKAVVLGADLADDGETRALVAQAVEALGPLSVLVNNASVFLDDRIDTLSAESWDTHLKVNLYAPIALAQAFATQGPAGAPEGASVVNLTDQRVWKPTPQFFSYSISKAGLWFATRTLAQALAPRIRVNAVGPGPTLPSIHQSPEDFAAEAANIPLERRSAPEDIARAVLYLVDASSVTGQMIAVDGGQHLAWRTPDVIDS